VPQTEDLAVSSVGKLPDEPRCQFGDSPGMSLDRLRFSARFCGRVSNQVCQMIHEKLSSYPSKMHPSPSQGQNLSHGSPGRFFFALGSP
jgi:hypothetical protein